jgi:hypothetical protein
LHLKIASNNNESDDLILPGYAINLLLDILTEMSKGNAIPVTPIHAELSTQEAVKVSAVTNWLHFWNQLEGEKQKISATA